MPLLHPSKRPPKEKVLPTTSTVAHPHPHQKQSPLDIPEILEQIFAFVDLYTLQTSVVRVCRLWFSMNQQHMRREVLWDSSLHSNNRDFNSRPEGGIGGMDDIGRNDYAMLVKIPGCYRLRWRSEIGAMQGPNWQSFINVMKRVIERQQKQGKTASTVTSTVKEWVSRSLNRKVGKTEDMTRNIRESMSLRDSPLREFDLIGNEYDLQLFGRAVTLFSSLTWLQLRSFSQGQIDMGQVLLCCPFLEVLQAEANPVLDLSGSWTSPLGKKSGAGNRNRSPLPLRSLVLKNARFLQLSLENLLAITPRLTTLQLFNLQKTGMVQEQDSPSSSTVFDYSWTRLFQYLKASPLVLETFHFSVGGHTMSDTEMHQMLFEICPTSPHWSFWTPNLIPALTQSLNQLPNVVTSLDLFFNERTRCFPSGLQDYLCASPHLLHLRAPSTAYPVATMDIYQRLPRRGAYPDTKDHNTDGSVRPSVWACRNLQSLHLGIAPHGFSMEFSSELNRVLFGFLSAVCPRLRDLQIESDFSTIADLKPVLHMDFKGGLCLLARLQYLETLHIGALQHVNSLPALWHLAWMDPTRQTHQQRAALAAEVTGWNTWLDHEKRAESKRVELHHGRDALVEHVNHLDGELRDQLKNLGLLSDVISMVDEMSMPGFDCWPWLDSLVIDRSKHLGQSVRKELDRLYPSRGK